MSPLVELREALSRRIARSEIDSSRITEHNRSATAREDRPFSQPCADLGYIRFEAQHHSESRVRWNKAKQVAKYFKI